MIFAFTSKPTEPPGHHLVMAHTGQLVRPRVGGLPRNHYSLLLSNNNNSSQLSYNLHTNSTCSFVRCHMRHDFYNSQRRLNPHNNFHCDHKRLYKK